jgi:hypothetical protein
MVLIIFYTARIGLKSLSNPAVGYQVITVVKFPNNVEDKFPLNRRPSNYQATPPRQVGKKGGATNWGEKKGLNISKNYYLC